MLVYSSVVFGIFVLVQANSETSHLNYNNGLLDEIEELFAPMKTELIALKQLIENVEQHEKIHQISSLAFTERLSQVKPNCLPETPFIETWAVDDVCFNMSTTLSIAADLSENVTSSVIDAATNLGSIFYEFINCKSINPVTGFQCMMREFDAFKSAIDGYKQMFLKYKDEIIQVFSELREQFDECIGIRKVKKNNAQKLIAETKLCQTMRPKN